MSLINQMLKDLEHRSRQTLPNEITLSGLHASALTKIKYSKSFYILWIFFISAIFFLLLIFKTIHFSTPPTILRTTPIKAPAFINESFISNSAFSALKKHSPASFAVLEQHSPASIVTGLTLQTQKEMTTLRILLSNDALYQLSVNSKKEYIILLEHTHLVSNLPAINMINSALKNIRMANLSNGNAMMILTPKPQGELNHIEWINTGKLPELQIDMTYKGDVYLENEENAMPTHSEMNEKSIQPFKTATKSFRPFDIAVEDKAVPSGTVKKMMVNMNAEDKYQQALYYSSHGLANKAIDILSQLIVKFSEYDSARELLAKILIDQGKPLEAKNIIQIGLKKRPYYYPYTELKARILVQEGQLSDAVKLLQSVAPSLNKDPDYHAFIAALYQRQGQSLLAAKLYEQLLPLQPDNATWWMGLGIAYENLGKHNDALQAYVRAEQSDTLNPELKAYVQSRIHSLQ